MKFAIVNLGCKVNRVESDAACAQLIAAGGKEGPLEAADLIVVNTCTVTGEAEKKTRKAVRHALRANDSAAVVVTGCAAAIRPDVFEEMSPRVSCVPKAMLEASLSERVQQFAGEGAMPHDEEPALLRIGGTFPTRVGVKVQDGCNNACTYCIVHVARGRATSRAIDEVVGECVAYARAGVKEIVLTGINLGSYRADDENGRIRLAGLLRRLLEQTASYRGECGYACRFRISSIEPRDVDDDLVEILAQENGRICRHLHLPLQAGSSKVLREMARPYDSAYFIDLVAKLRTAVPTLSLSTDVIAGFPGETDEDFNETLSVARTCAFSKIHVFPYSVRKGTPAAARPDQVSPEAKESRSATLRSLADELREADYARRIGTHELVLVEQSARGMTESYYEVPVPSDAPCGALVDMPLPTLSL